MARYDEEELLALSALQHLVFCPRQCALIHIEGVWSENALTAEGRILHEQADSEQGETRGGVRIARGLPLRCLRLGLSGKADVVEFRRPDGPSQGCRLEGFEGRWLPMPVEYKRGRPKRDPSDKVQLCAQALCLEEMLQTEVPSGALFYAATRRRQEVEFDPELRRLTESLSQELHRLIANGVTPRFERMPKCRRCSLQHACLPHATGPGRSGRRYLEGLLGS